MNKDRKREVRRSGSDSERIVDLMRVTSGSDKDRVTGWVMRFAMEENWSFGVFLIAAAIDFEI